MFFILTKIKTDKIEGLVEWNSSTFGIRQDSGLVAMRAFRNTKETDEYYVISYWNSKEEMEAYVNEPNNQNMFKSSVIEWYKELEEFPAGNLGEVSI